MRIIATTIIAIATLFAAGSAFCQNAVAPPAGPAAAAPMAAAASTPAQGKFEGKSEAKSEAKSEGKSEAKPSPSTSDSRSAAALALSSEPTFDEGTAQRIREAALSYSDLAVRGGWPTIPADAKFALGAQGPQDELLRRRLIVSGDLAAEKASGPYDGDVAAGVKRFQARHGLAATGTMTPRTLAALNVPVQKRIQQLEASLERVVNMNFGFGQRYVVVNIPAAYAEAVENDKVVRRYRVIVGKTEKPSPTLTAEITKNEIAAHMRKDPNYLARMHMELLDAHDGVLDPRAVDWSAARTPNFTVRQESGAWNALGSVRIDMPNSYSVYMHDTNQKNLFSDDYRFDSHGCARVDNVRDLAAWLLKDLPKWNRQEIDLVIASGQREDIHLPQKIPVAWIYLTAWMSRDQTIQFRNDIYDQDTQLLEATAEEEAFFNQASAHPLAGHLAR
jgi:L,D-transpeptidase YcbB